MSGRREVEAAPVRSAARGRTVVALAALLLGATVGCKFDTSALGGSDDGGIPPLDGPGGEVGRDTAAGDLPPNDDHVVVDGDGPSPDDGPQTDGPPQDDGPPCATGDHRCHYVGEDLEVCSNGVWSKEQTCPLGCYPQEKRCYAFEPRNVPAGTFDQGNCDWVVDSNLSVSTDSPSTFPCGSDYANATQSSCREIMYFKVRSLWVKPGVTLTFTGTRVAAVIAKGTILVEGTIDVSATGGAPGPGGYVGGGLGVAGDAPSGHAAPTGNGDGNYGDSGGSGGCHGGAGGNGGQGGNASGGGQCTACGSALGTPLCGGGGGGGGRPACGGGGGHGGGSAQLSAAVSVTVSGSILAGGGGGGGGCGSGGYTSGGGGGAGGGVLLEAPRVVVSGVVAANGGGGGGGGYYNDGSGSNGPPGRADRQVAVGGAGGRNGNADYGRGGNGGAGSTGATSGGNAPDNYQNGGGGGGAFGRVVVWARAGTWVPGGTISPDPQAHSITPQ
ncbi:MAG: hypothetical protein HY906_27360 [Deltaproteobacteria bacterium]|nr:hypothetical protein [Deltaproteobacteria bacterium]